jgi:hypothetical protein
MEKITDKPLNTRTKISLNVNKELLKIIDEISKLTKSNRTLIMESILVKGISPLLDQLESTWERFLSEERYNGKKEKLGEILQNLRKIREKHLLANSRESWEKILEKKNLDEKKKKEIINFLKECGFS